MKVLLLTDYALSWDDAPSSRLLCLGRELADDGHTVRVVGAGGCERPHVDGVEVMPLPYPAAGGWAQFVFPLRRAVRDQVRWCDAVLVRGYWVAFWAFCYALCLRVNHRIYDFHGMNARQQWLDRRRLRSFSTWVIEQAVLTLATDILVIGRVLRERFTRRRSKTLLLENGVRVNEFETVALDAGSASVLGTLALRPGRPVFVLVAHFGSWYEPQVVVRAAGLAGELLECLVVGDGPGLEAARRVRQQYGLSNVQILERLPHHVIRYLLTNVAYACLCPYDAAWCASLPAGYFVSRKVKEYFAAGKPVVCSDVPQRESFLRDGETCMLYRAGDSEDLARRMVDLAGQPERARRLGDRGRALVQEFSWQHTYRASGLSERLRESSI